MSVSASGEDGLIARFFAPLAVCRAGSPCQAFGLLDDAAVLTPPQGQDLVLSKDALVAGVHFFAHDDPALIARKALRVNISDLAAKGAQPLGYLLALALPPAPSDAWLEAFSKGLAQDQAEYGIALLGGDTVKTNGELMISITVVGCVPHGRMVRRTTAQVGDVLAVTGTIGDSALGCRVLAGHSLPIAPSHLEFLQDRDWLPRPRLSFAPHLLRYASAAMDISDGFVGDLAKLCRVSGVSVQVNVEDIPLSDATRAAVQLQPPLLESVLGGGDDFEVLFTVAPQHLAALRRTHQPITVLGHIEPAGQGAQIFQFGKKLDVRRPSYSHF